MPKGVQSGAITLRPPKGADAKAEYLRIKDLMDHEIAHSKAMKDGPTTYTQVILDALRDRYARELKDATADDTRVSKERKGEPALELGEFFK